MGTEIHPIHTGLPFKEKMDRDILRVDVIAQISRAGLTEPCRIMTDDGDTILMREIPLVYARDVTTVVSIPTTSVLNRLFAQRLNSDKTFVVPGIVATTFCLSDARSNGMSDIFYCVGLAGGRVAPNAATLLPGAALYGVLNSKILNRRTNLMQYAHQASHIAYELANMYGGSALEGRYSTNPGLRHAFMGYLASNSNAQFAPGEPRPLSMYALQFPLTHCGDEGEDICPRGCSISADSECSTTDILITLEFEYPAKIHPTLGLPPLEGYYVVGGDDPLHNPTLN